MRDQRKPASYFEAYLKKNAKNALIFEEDLKNSTAPEQAQRIHGSLSRYRMNILIASFSSGADAAELQKLLSQVIFDLVRADLTPYSSLLTALSFAVMLGGNDAIQPALSRFRSECEEDKLLNGLRSFLETGNASWSGEYKFPRKYQALDAVFGAETSEKREAALLKYLKSWYSKNKDAAWHDALNNKHDIYYGYWCFESAALAKIYGLNERTLSQSEYYPQL